MKIWGGWSQSPHFLPIWLVQSYICMKNEEKRLFELKGGIIKSIPDPIKSAFSIYSRYQLKLSATALSQDIRWWKHWRISAFICSQPGESTAASGFLGSADSYNKKNKLRIIGCWSWPRANSSWVQVGGDMSVKRLSDKKRNAYQISSIGFLGFQVSVGLNPCEVDCARAGGFKSGRSTLIFISFPKKTKG